jgi:Tol biopolymer transport system component
MLTATNAPQPGASANVAAELAWYHGRSSVLSDFGDIVYTIYPAKGLYTEVWAMHPDSSGKHRLRSYLGVISPGASGWLPGAQQLLVKTGSVILGAPGLKTRTIDTNFGHPMMGDELWLLNAATGQSTPTDLPRGFSVHYSQISPNGGRVAFVGTYKPDPRSFKGHEGGIWIYDFTRGELRRLADAGRTPLAWSPDSRGLVTSSSKEYVYEHDLARIDATTGEVTNLGLSGADGAFSPDGTRLAYCGEFAPSSGWMRGVPRSGSVWVADLANGGAARRVSPPHEGALDPQWSPDGMRVAYIVVRSEGVSGKRKYHSRLSVAEADGSGVMTLGEFDTWIRAFAWAPSEDMVYAVTDSVLGSGGVLAIAADGSGLVTDLGGTAKDSILSAEDQRQTDAAVKELQEAFFEFVSGEIAQLDGNLTASRKAFRTAAGIFSAIAWKYPRAGFIPDDLVCYVDEAIKRAEEPAASALHEACRQRLDILSGWLWRFVDANQRLPKDLAELEDWMVQTRHEKPEDVASLFACPFGTEAGHPEPYRYNPRAWEGHLKLGEVIVNCPQHPDVKIAWDKDFLMRLGEVAAIPRDRLEKLGELP